MRFVLPVTALALAAVARANSDVSANADHLYNLAAGGRQEQLPIAELPPETRTATVTETQTFFEVMETVYMTKSQLVPTYVAVPVPAHEVLVKVEPEPKEEEACDEQKEIGCAVCRTIHRCEGLEEECTPCDSSPACMACWPAMPSKKEILPPVVDLGVTCSLGPGRTVPCELVEKDSEPGPVFKFGE